ncbi:MAG: carbohydrate-binding protein [Ramlibacter sp.]
MSLTIVKPVQITDAMLLATDVPENDYAEWSNAVAYSVGQRVIVAAAHKVYECVKATTSGAAGQDPTTAAGATYWLEVSPTNRWKLLDSSNSTQTAQAGGFSYTIKPGEAVNAIALLNVTATTVRVRVTDPSAGLVYDKSFSLVGIIPSAGWYDYFFATVSPQDQVIALDLPPYSGASIQVDVTAASGDAKCGVLMMGYQMVFGEGIKYGARAGITDYSRKDTNTWGDMVLDQRAYSKTRDWAMDVPNEQIDALERAFISVRATPCLWVGFEGYAIATVFGFYKDFEIGIQYEDYSDCSLTIEGMT